MSEREGRDQAESDSQAMNQEKSILYETGAISTYQRMQRERGDRWWETYEPQVVRRRKAKKK